MGVSVEHGHWPLLGCLSAAVSFSFFRTLHQHLPIENIRSLRITISFYFHLNLAVNGEVVIHLWTKRHFKTWKLTSWRIASKARALKQKLTKTIEKCDWNHRYFIRWHTRRCPWGSLHKIQPFKGSSSRIDASIYRQNIFSYWPAPRTASIGWSSQGKRWVARENIFA